MGVIPRKLGNILFLLRLSAKRCSWASMFRPKRDRIARLFRWRNAVLPTPTRFVSHDVRRARFELQRKYFGAPSLLRRITSQPHPARTAERDTGYDLEIRNVAMPAELRPGLVFGNN